MRPPSLAPLLASALASALAAVPALADSVRVVHAGDTVEGTIQAGVLEAIPVDVVDGTLLDITLKMAPGSGPGGAVMQPDRTLLPDLFLHSGVDGKNAQWKAKKVPLLQSGRHWILVDAATPGAYRLQFKAKPLTKAGFAGFVVADPPIQVVFGGVPGALATVTAKRSRLSALEPKVVAVRGPAGTDLDLGTAASRKTTLSLDQVSSLPLLLAGDHQARVGTQTGLAGDIGTVAVSVKFPKYAKETRTDADVIVDPFVDAVSPSFGFDNLAYSGLAVTGEFFRPGAAIRIEGGEVLRSATGVTYGGNGQLGFDLDLAGVPAGTYHMVVTLADGAEGRLAGGFTVIATPLPVSITPSLGFDNRTQAFTVAGSRFQVGAQVAAIPASGGTIVGGVVLSLTDTSISVSFPLLDAELGDWDVRVTNPDGGTNVLAAGLQVAAGPRVAGVSPLLGHDNDAARSLALTGSAFQSGMACVLERAGQSPIGGAVSGVTAASATAVFDLRGRASGDWTLRVTNPDGGTIPGASPFAIARAPRVQSLSPARGFEGETLSGVSAGGTDFVSGAAATLERAGSATVSALNEAVGGGGTTLAFDLPVGSAAPGAHDLRVVNPDAGSERLADAFRVLGTRTLESAANLSGPPSVAYGAEDDIYLVTWSAWDGTQRDIKARRFDAATGEPLGSEIAVTSVVDDGSTTLSQVDPCAVYAPEIDKWVVVYGWKDPSASTNKTGVLMQLLDRDGTVHTPQSQAYPIASHTTGVVGPPRAAWNPERQECLAVWAWDVGSSPDVYYGMMGGWSTLGGVLIPFDTMTGTLIANTHQATVDGNQVTILDSDSEPDVAYGSVSDEWVVVYTFDAIETGNPMPADTLTDVRAFFYDDDFSSGPVVRTHLTTLGDTASKQDRMGRVGFDPASNRFLAAWEYSGTAGNRDIRAWLLNGATRAKVGASPTTVDAAGAGDAAVPAVAFDATSGANAWLVAFAAAPGVDGVSTVRKTRLPVDGAASSGLGTATQVTLAGALADASFAGAALAARAAGGEFLAGWTTTGSGKAPVDAEVRFLR